MPLETQILYEVITEERPCYPLLAGAWTARAFVYNGENITRFNIRPDSLTTDMQFRYKLKTTCLYICCNMNTLSWSRGRANADNETVG